MTEKHCLGEGGRGNNPRKNIVSALSGTLGSLQPYCHQAVLQTNLREVQSKPCGWCKGFKLTAQLLITASPFSVRCQDLEKKLWKRRGRRSMEETCRDMSRSLCLPKPAPGQCLCPRQWFHLSTCEVPSWKIQPLLMVS